MWAAFFLFPAPLSLCPWLYTQCIYIYTGMQREGAALSLTDTHCSPYRCVCVCIGAELFTQTPCVWIWLFTQQHLHSSLCLSLQIYRENTLISHTVLSIRLYTRTCAHRDLHAGTPLSLYTYAYIYSYARRAGHTYTQFLSLYTYIMNRIYTLLYIAMLCE